MREKSNRELVAELQRMTCLLQGRAIAAAMGLPPVTPTPSENTP